MKIVLASQSPRRKELLAHTVSKSETEPTDIDETPFPDEQSVDYVRRMAEERARTAWEQNEKENHLVITSDVTVVLNQEIMSRPEDLAEVEFILKKLSGEIHTIYTAVILKTKERGERILAEAHVTFYPLAGEEIKRCLKTGGHANKAGAYGIQNVASVFVKEISGDYHNVVRFPIGAVNQALKTFI